MAKRPPTHEMISSRKAPKPVGPYSQAVRTKNPGEILYVSGQIPIEVPSGNVFRGEIKKQAELALNHVRNIVQDAGFVMDDLVKVTIYLTDMKQFDAVNEVYTKFFVGAMLPARAVVGVAALPKEVNVEIEAIAIKKGQSAMDELFGDEDKKAGPPRH
jgi:2-iminobutanoate/2-iminopropanoate deaminase